MFGMDTYEENVRVFEKVLSSEADKLLSEKDLAVVYIGRSSCPFCRKFAKNLSALVDEVNTTIYYVDSENSLDNGIDSFREKYNVRTVPGFLVGKNGSVEVICDSSLSDEEILDLVK